MARRRSNRTSIGRQKVEIRRIEKPEARHVCFSKRRVGLFKKASELAILCGVQIAVVTFSPARKAFAFGHPSVQAVIERYASTGLGGGAGAGDDNGKLLEELNRRYADLRARIDAEKARKERVDAAMAKEVAEAAHPVVAMLQADVRDLGEKELVAYDAALADVQAAMAAPANQMLQDAINQGRVMAARARYQVIQPPQQFLLAANGAARFVGQFDAGSSSSANNNNGAGMDMHVHHQMMMAMAMPPPPGFAASGMQTQPPPPGIAASGMPMLPPPPGFAAGMPMLPPPGFGPY